MKRLLLSASEAGILVVGIVCSLVSSILLTFRLEDVQSTLAQVVLIFGLALTVVAFLVVRRTTQAWKIAYDADRWQLEQAERRLYPNRTKYKRIAKQVVVCVPSLIAAVVVFFFPVATHLVPPFSNYLRYYRVPIPWNLAVLSLPGAPRGYGYVAFASSDGKGRFGMTPFFDSTQLSEISFGSVDPNADFEFNHKLTDQRRTAATQALRRDFRLNSVAITCWQYVDRYRPRGQRVPWWSIDCETPVQVRRLNLYAWFFGREDDIPLFYRIIEGITPVE